MQFFPFTVSVFVLADILRLQFAYLQVGTIISTVVRMMELRIDKVPEHNYHVSPHWSLIFNSNVFFFLQTLITMPKTPRVLSYRRRKLD